MADIVLLDRDGIPVSYSVPEQIAVEGHGNDDKETTFKYTRLTILNCYAGQFDSGNFTVTKKITSMGSGDIWITGLGEDDLKNYGIPNSDGKYAVMLLITTKSLTVGNTYTENEYT